MHGKIYFALLLLSLALLASSCGPGRELTRRNRIEVLAGPELLDRVVRNQLQAETLDGKARIQYDDGSFSMGVTASIKMIKDSLIWMSVKKFGFEVARAMITQDSLYVLDRINNEYAVEPLSYIEDRYNLPGNLGMMQQVLLGNPVFLTTANPESTLEADTYRLTASSGSRRNELWLSAADYQLQRLAVSDEAENRSLDMSYDAYADAGLNRDFSYLRMLEVDSDETGNARITIEFNQVDFDVPTEIRFDVPSRYQRMGK
ncbi:MAG: DUF4292 domain-containing protein [Lewinella sp.]|nr:DUF4292 domain-containing protein [Lewinella sp.]